MKFKLVQKGNPQKPAEPKKWYANAVNSGTVSSRKISNDIAGRSSLTRGDVSNVIENLIDELPKHLLDGSSIKLGDFGSFRLSISGKGAEKKEDFNASLIEKVKVIFTPGTLIKNKLKTIHFEQIKE